MMVVMMFVLMLMIVAVFMMIVIVFVLMIVFVQGFLFMALHRHLHMGAGNAAFDSRFRFHLHAGQAEAVHLIQKSLSVGNQFQQGRHQHIPRCAHGAFKIQRSHRLSPFGSFRYLPEKRFRVSWQREIVLYNSFCSLNRDLSS